MPIAAHTLIRKLALVLGVALFTAGAVYSAEPDLPDIGNPAGSILSKDDEYSIGRMIVRQLRDQQQIIEDPEVTEYLNAVGSKLATQAPDGAPHFQFFAFKESVINAFASMATSLACK